MVGLGDDLFVAALLFDLVGVLEGDDDLAEALPSLALEVEGSRFLDSTTCENFCDVLFSLSFFAGAGETPFDFVGEDGFEEDGDDILSSPFLVAPAVDA